MSRQKNEEKKFHESCLAVDEKLDALTTFAAKLLGTVNAEQLGTEPWTSLAPELRGEIIERKRQLEGERPVNAFNYIDDINGLELIGKALLMPGKERTPNVQFSNTIWRDGGLRQDRLGQQLIRLAKAMKGTQTNERG